MNQKLGNLRKLGKSHTRSLTTGITKKFFQPIINFETDITNSITRIKESNP